MDALSFQQFLTKLVFLTILGTFTWSNTYNILHFWIHLGETYKMKPIQSEIIFWFYFTFLLYFSAQGRFKIFFRFIKIWTFNRWDFEFWNKFLLASWFSQTFNKTDQRLISRPNKKPISNSIPHLSTTLFPCAFRKLLSPHTNSVKFTNKLTHLQKATPSLPSK